MPDEIRKDMGDPTTRETSPDEPSPEEEQSGIELQEIVPSATVSGEIRQPPPDDSSNISLEEAINRRHLPLQRSWDSASSESLQPEELLLSDESEHSFKKSKLALRRGSSSKSPEEETDATGVGDSMIELSAGPGPSGYCGKNYQKENESPMLKMAEKCSQVVGEITSAVTSSLKSCIRPPLSEQGSTASLEDGNESDSATEMASPGSFQPGFPLSDSTQYSFSSSKLVFRRISSTSISPEKKTDEAEVEDPVTELSASPGPSGYSGNVQKDKSPIKNIVEKCTKAAEELVSEIKSLKSYIRPPLSEQSSSASLADGSESDSAMEVVSSGSLQQDNPLPDSTEPSFSNTKLVLPRGSSISPEKEIEVQVGDSMTETPLRPTPPGYCDKTQQAKNESVTKLVEKCSEALEEVASGKKSSLSSARLPLSEQTSSASLADVSENELDSTMEVDSRSLPNETVSHSVESKNNKIAFQIGSPAWESPEKTDAATVEGSVQELSGRPGFSGYCGNVQENVSPLKKFLETCTKIAKEKLSGEKPLRSGTKPPPLSKQKSSSSSFADVSENESESSTETARKYRKLLNKRKASTSPSVPDSQQQTRIRRKQLHRQANVEEGVEMETMFIHPETSTQETQTDTAKERFYSGLGLLSDSDFSTSKETENDDTEDTSE